MNYSVLSYRPAWESAGSQALGEYVQSVARELGDPVELSSIADRARLLAILLTRPLPG